MSRLLLAYLAYEISFSVDLSKKGANGYRRCGQALPILGTPLERAVTSLESLVGRERDG